MPDAMLVSFVDNGLMVLAKLENAFFVCCGLGAIIVAKVTAKAILVGGQSGAPSSPHFFDQAARYARGALRDIHFYPDDIAKHATEIYHPGQSIR